VSIRVLNVTSRPSKTVLVSSVVGFNVVLGLILGSGEGTGVVGTGDGTGVGKLDGTEDGFRDTQ